MRRRSLLILAIVACLLAGMYGWLRWHDSRQARASVSNLGSLGLAGIVSDTEGNLYVSAKNLNQVLEITSRRRARLVAGNGQPGFGGDGAAAVDSMLDQPMGLALDSDKNLFIADMGNNRIRRLNLGTGNMTTVAGNGKMGGGAGSAATSSGLYEPVSVAADGQGNLYIGGTTSLGIRRVDAITGIQSKALGADLPGDPMAAEPAAGPFWVVVGAADKIFFSDPTRHAVFFLDAARNEAHALAGSTECGFAGDDVPATGSLLCFPEGLAVDSKGNLYIADTGNNRIRKVDLNTGIVSTVAGNGHADRSGDQGDAFHAGLDGPMGVAVDSKGNLYIADTGNDCIRKVNSSNGLITTWMTGRELAAAARR